MKNVRISSKALSVLLALLMVVSTVIILPAAAIEGEPAVTNKNVIWSYDFSKMEAMDATATSKYTIDNDLFVLSTTGGVAANITADETGFLNLKANTAINGNPVGDGLTEETMPLDFFNLFFGLYDGYDFDASEYFWEFDFRYDQHVVQYRNCATTYTAADSTAYSALYTRDVGYSFFTPRADNQYYALFRISDDGRMYSRSNGVTVTKESGDDMTGIYYKSGNQFLPVSEIGGDFAAGKTATWANCVDRADLSKSYQLTVGDTYRIGVKFEVLGKYEDRTDMRATVYVKPAGADEWAACVGYDDYSYKYDRAGSWTDGVFTAGASGSTNYIRLAEVDNQGSIGGNWEIYTSANKQLLWSIDLKNAGTVTGKTNVLAFAEKYPNFYLSNGNTNVKIEAGMIRPTNGSTVIAPKDGVVDLFDVLTGQAYDGKYFFEFDYKFGSDNPTTGRSDTSTTVAGATVTAVTDYADNGGANWNFRIGGNEFIFRVSPNGYLYTNDIDKGLSSVKTGIDGYIYYTDATLGKVYFDANGYRYTETSFEGAVVVDGKYYVDDPAGTAPTVSGMSLTSCLDPAYIDRAYRVTENTIYRIGLATVKDGTSVKHTVYIKEAGAENWEKCVGTSTQTVGSTITFTGSTGIYYGGQMEAYVYTCTAGNHMPGMVTSGRKVSEYGVEYFETSCAYCGAREAIKDGVAYTSAAVDNGCGGSHTVWTSTQNPADTFITDVVAANHSFNDAGYCSACGNFSYWMEFPKKADGSAVNSISRATNDYNGDSTVTSPAYTTANGYVDAPESGMILRWLPDGYDFMSPFVVSVDIYFDSAIKSAGTSATAWPIFQYRTGVTSITNYGYLVGVQSDKDSDGNAIGDPYLVLGNYEDRKIADIAYDTWYNIQVAVDPVSQTYYIYLDGELIGSDDNLSRATDAAAACFVVGVQTHNGDFVFAYRAKNIGFEQTTLEGLFTGFGLNTFMDTNYGMYEGLKGQNNHFGSYTEGMGGSSSTSSMIGDYVISTGTGYRQFTLSHLSGEEEFNLSDKKYEIRVEFAVPKTDVMGPYATDYQKDENGEFVLDEDGDKILVYLTDEGGNRYRLEGADGLVDALQYDGQNETNAESHNLVRLSKYSDAISTALLGYNKYGWISANGKALYLNNMVRASVLHDFNEDGTPKSTTDLRVIVDEKNQTYSVYINDAPAYYSNDGVFTPYVDMPMPSFAKGKVTEEVSSYSEITKEMAVAAGYTGLRHYARVLRNMECVAIKNVSVTLIPDDSVEFVGAQTRTADGGAADGTFDLRFIFGIDDIFNNAVSFKVTAYDIDGNVHLDGEERTTNVFYSAINAGDGVLKASQCTEGQYLTALRILGITETSASDRYVFEITPYVVDIFDNPVPAGVTVVVTCNGLGQNIVTSYK